MLNSEARPWRIAEFIVHYVYLSTMLLNGALILWLPRIKNVPYEDYKAIFVGLIGLTLLTFPLAFLVYRRFVNQAALEHIRLVTGEGKACSVFKMGAILLTLLGDFSGVAGASLFTFTRSTSSLIFFLASWAVQYALCSLWVYRGKLYFQQIPRTSDVSVLDKTA